MTGPRSTPSRPTCANDAWISSTPTCSAPSSSAPAPPAWPARPSVVATVHSSRVRSKSDIAALAAETPLIDHLIAPSEAIAAKLRREGRGSAEITVIPNGVDLHRFGARRSPEDRAATRASLGIPADAFLIGVVARLEPEKGHRYLLAAWPEIAQAVPNAWLAAGG